VDNLCCKI